MDVNRSPIQFTFGGSCILNGAWSFLASHQARNPVRAFPAEVMSHDSGSGNVLKRGKYETLAPLLFLRAFHCSF
jgi:hypothetical protein